LKIAVKTNKTLDLDHIADPNPETPKVRIQIRKLGLLCAFYLQLVCSLLSRVNVRLQIFLYVPTVFSLQLGSETLCRLCNPLISRSGSVIIIADPDPTSVKQLSSLF